MKNKTAILTALILTACAAAQTTTPFTVQLSANNIWLFYDDGRRIQMTSDMYPKCIGERDRPQLSPGGEYIAYSFSASPFDPPYIAVLDVAGNIIARQNLAHYYRILKYEWIDSNRLGIMREIAASLADLYQIFDIRTWELTDIPGKRFSWSPDKTELIYQEFVHPELARADRPSDTLILDDNTVFPFFESAKQSHRIRSNITWAPDGSRRVAFLDCVTRFKYAIGPNGEDVYYSENSNCLIILDLNTLHFSQMPIDDYFEFNRADDARVFWNDRGILFNYDNKTVCFTAQ